MIKAFPLVKMNCMLGESPLWHTVRKSLMWVDIEGRSLHEYDERTRHVNSWLFDRRVSLVIEAENDFVLLGLQGCLGKFNLGNGDLTELLHIEKEYPDHRLNDGACDSEGRLWLGTMHIDCITGAGALYCVEKDGTCKKKLKNLSISNGLGWPADNSRFYHIDSPTRTVQSYRFDLKEGEIDFRENVIDTSGQPGMPDGMAIDQEGMLWIAHWGGFGVYRWDPFTGKCIDKIELPVPNVTSCAFGGNKLEYLFITTARQGLSEEDLEKYPESGNVFWAKPGIRGAKVHPFRGFD